MSGCIERLARAIGYPEKTPPGATTCVLSVDGRPVEAREQGGRLLLVSVLAAVPGEATLARCAGYAAGRMLREEAVLAWEPQDSSLILWQGVAASAPEAVLKRFFEVYMTSCDWWLSRLSEAESASSVPEMVIRP